MDYYERFCAFRDVANKLIYEYGIEVTCAIVHNDANRFIEVNICKDERQYAYMVPHDAESALVNKLLLRGAEWVVNHDLHI